MARNVTCNLHIRRSVNLEIQRVRSRRNAADRPDLRPVADIGAGPAAGPDAAPVSVPIDKVTGDEELYQWQC
jgi:hypothetical protein